MNRFALASARLTTRSLKTPVSISISGVQHDICGIYCPAEEITNPETGEIGRRETITVAKADITAIPAVNTAIMVGTENLYVRAASENGPVVVIELTRRRIQ